VDLGVKDVYWSRKASASAVAAATMEGSIIMRPCSGASGGTHWEGKVGPKMGIKAPAMWEQKVAQTASAQE
jgi:hypothetical protein